MNDNLKHPSHSHPQKINIGIDERSRTEVAHGLSMLLADTHLLYLKTHKFHWNVTGPMFETLHLMFEKQYTELFEASDIVAERIRALGVFAPGSLAEFTKLSAVKEESGNPEAKEMIRILLDGHETIARTARSVFPVAERAADESTKDLLTERLKYHEKTGWMLRSMLE